jgi:hypothetical protein
MFNRFYLTVFLLCLLLTTACNKDKSSDNPPCPTFTLAATADSAIAAGDTLGLNATLLTGAVYSWTGPDGFTSSIHNPYISEITSLQEGTYRVSAVVNGVCTTNVDSVTVIVICDRPEPVYANAYKPIITGNGFQLFATSITDSVNYLWTGPNNFSSSVQNPIIAALNASTAGTYKVYAYLNNCYSIQDSVIIAANQCNPNNRSFATSLGANDFFYSFGTATLFPATRSITGTGLNGISSLRTTFAGLSPPTGNYTVNAAHCPSAGGTLAPNECCIEYTDSSGTYLGVSGTVSLTGTNAYRFCSIPFRLQFTTSTLFIAAGKVDY